MLMLLLLLGTCLATASGHPKCASVKTQDRIDCHPDGSLTQDSCLARHCCWNVSDQFSEYLFGPPSCFFPSSYVGYSVKEIIETTTRTRIILKRRIPSGFTDDIENVVVDVDELDDYKVRVKIYDQDTPRYEVAVPKLNIRPPKTSSKLYEITCTNHGLLMVMRRSTGTVIFKTQLKLLTFADQYLQLTSTLPSKYVYGLGEHKDYFRKEADWKLYTMFNSDDAPNYSPSTNSYGTQPFYMTTEDSVGNSNGILMFNSNAMDVILQPTPAITWRSIGGIFDFFILLGPSPNQVIRQYSFLVGLPAMPPFWALGFHLSRDGYMTVNRTEWIMQNNINVGIPLEVQWNDIDAMQNYNDFTYDRTNYKGLPEFIERVHRSGRKYVPIIDVGIGVIESGNYQPYEDGVRMDIFIKNATGQILRGKVWNDNGTVFPDFIHPKGIEFWTKQFKEYHKMIRFDGIWNDMNEPSNPFSDGSLDGCPMESKYESPQYVPGGQPLKTRTICMTARHYRDIHYNLHNTYGLTEIIASNYALKSLNKRPFVLSRATFIGHGHYAAHWNGDIIADWEEMRWTISAMLNNNLFAIPLVGSDICGFNGEPSVELCARWSALGAFYPFSRNHNCYENADQDPWSMGSIVVAAAKSSLEIRYSLLSYLYTLFYKAHAFGDTVFRPLFFEFPNDQNSYSMDEQFMWGEALLIIPALYQGVDTVSGYIPPGVWYDLFDSTTINSGGAYMTFQAPLTSPPIILVRGGHVITTQQPKLTTTETRKGNFSLIVALDENQKAKGDLFWDDGEALEINGKYNYLTFLVQQGILIIDRVYENYSTKMILDVVTVLGQQEKPKEVLVNQKPVGFIYQASLKRLDISVGSVSLLNDLIVQWK